MVMLGAHPLCFPSLRDHRFIISCFPFSETVEYILYTCLFVNSERENPNTSNLIPKDFEIIVNTTLNEFYSSIDRAALLTQS